MDIGERMRKLKEEEEQQLAEIRQKILDEEEFQRKEDEKRLEEEELCRLKTREDHLLRKLGEIRKRKFQLEIEELSWERVLRAKEEEVKRLKAKLDEHHEVIWANRDEFCTRIDSYLDKHEHFTRTWHNNLEAHESDQEKEIRELEAYLTEEEKKGRELDLQLEKLQEEIERSQREAVNDPERKRLEEWIQVTRERCAELEKRVSSRKRSSASIKPASQLFSMLSVDDIKKISRPAHRSNESKDKIA